jgi:hypothetical protein
MPQHNKKFQWAGLAAFASKQVGCGLMQANDDYVIFGALETTSAVMVPGTASLIIVLPKKYDPHKLLRDLYHMLTLGNLTLFLDIYPLHKFYEKEGFDKMEHYLKIRRNITSEIYWPVSPDTLDFFPNLRLQVHNCKAQQLN